MTELTIILLNLSISANRANWPAVQLHPDTGDRADYIEDRHNQQLPVQLDVGRVEEGSEIKFKTHLWKCFSTYMAEAIDWTNLKMPNAEADFSTNTPPRMEMTWKSFNWNIFRPECWNKHLRIQAESLSGRPQQGLAVQWWHPHVSLQ